MPTSKEVLRVARARFGYSEHLDGCHRLDAAILSLVGQALALVTGAEPERVRVELVTSR